MQAAIGLSSSQSRAAIPASFIHAATMSKAIIAPSVLASDLSNLTAECKRMISEGADWLHMGTYFGVPHASSLTALSQMLWMGELYFPIFNSGSDISAPRHSHFVPNITMGAPILTCVKKGVPEIFMDCHMMVADPIKVCICSMRMDFKLRLLE